MHLTGFELHVCLVRYGTIYDLWVSNVITTIFSIHIVDYHELEMSTVKNFNYKPNLQNPLCFHNVGNIIFLKY